MIKMQGNIKILESYEYECGKKYKSIKHDKGNFLNIIYLKLYID